MKTVQEKYEYAMGMYYGNYSRQKGVDLNPEMLLKGLQDGMSNNLALSREEIAKTMREVNQDIAKRSAEADTKLGEKAAKDGEVFRAEYAKKADVKSFTNGVLYRILKDGTGEVAKPTDLITFHLVGTIPDGTEFENSPKRGRPYTLPANGGGLLPGWKEPFAQMKPGAKWEVVLPPDQAFGARRNGPKVPPQSTVIFQIELLEVKPAPPTPAPGATVSGEPVTSDIIKVPSAEEMKKGAKIEVIKAEDLKANAAGLKTNTPAKK